MSVSLLGRGPANGAGKPQAAKGSLGKKNGNPTRSADFWPHSSADAFAA